MQATSKTKKETKTTTKENTRANARSVKLSSSSSTQPSSAEPRQTTIEIANTGNSNGGIYDAYDASPAIKEKHKKQNLDARKRDRAPSVTQRILGKAKEKIGI
ncbi:hypothetical protein BOTNAR_0078g00130 [Botryotinia narcissicola]|uniref:Uncharacterized protein n=1 Tax=Botryotinia narcissicola TaxID=278944 RepID=A0A4Z1J8W4_9HELO|nr:hypothetical protein BOTNAR_0078g00130 [Botryotinia narcissicola]